MYVNVITFAMIITSKQFAQTKCKQDKYNSVNNGYKNAL